MRIETQVLITALFVVGLVGCDQDDASEALRADVSNSANTNPGVLVETTIAQVKSVVDQVDSVGTLYGAESVTLTAKVTEQVQAVYFEGGEFVAQGQVLAELHDEEQQALLAEAKATLREAELQRERLQSLGKDIATLAQLDVSQAKVDASRAQVMAAESRINDRKIRAPFSGIVGFRQISVGALVSPGTVIAELDTVDPLKLDFTLPEVFISQLSVGDRVSGRNIAWPGVIFTGEVERIGSRVDPVSRAFPVRAVLDNGERRLRPGMLINVRVAIEREPGIVIPESALMQVGDQSSVYVVDASGKAERRPVQLGHRQHGEVVLRGGIQPGERIITTGQVLLRPGVAVQESEPSLIEGAATHPTDHEE